MRHKTSKGLKQWTSYMFSSSLCFATLSALEHFPECISLALDTRPPILIIERHGPNTVVLCGHAFKARKAEVKEGL